MVLVSLDAIPMHAIGARLRKWRIFIGATVLHILLSSTGPIAKFPCVDEVGALPAAVSHWRYARFDMYRVNPPLPRLIVGFFAWRADIDYNWIFYSTEPGDRPEFHIGVARLASVGVELSNEFIGPRILSISFSFIGAICLFAIFYSKVGICSANLACLLWYCCPNLLAFTPTIIPDVCAVSMGLLACCAGCAYLRKPSISCIAGFVLGLALLSKLTWITAIATIPATTFALIVATSRYASSRSGLLRIMDLGGFWLAALVTLNAGYLFEDSFKPLGEYEFCSEMFGGKGSSSSVHGNRFRSTWLGRIPVPVPRNYLLGIDYLKHEVEEKKWSFLLGEWRLGSWPQYYIMTTLFKTPEPTLVAALIGLGVLIVGIQRRMVEPKVISMFLFLGIPAGACFASVSLQGGFNHHHRYVLMIYPFVFALAAYVASPVASRLLRFRLPFLGPRKRSIAVPLAITLVTLSAISSLRVHPYYTSYFNTLSGGPENGWRLLGFSNIDWGQDILEVDKWLKRHPDRRPVVMDLDYFGMNGELFDVPTSLPPKLPRDASIDEVRKSITETQWWIISVKRLYNFPDHDGLEYLQQLKPVERIAFAYHVYRIDPIATDAEREKYKN